MTTTRYGSNCERKGDAEALPVLTSHIIEEPRIAKAMATWEATKARLLQETNERNLMTEREN